MPASPFAVVVRLLAGAALAAGALSCAAPESGSEADSAAPLTALPECDDAPAAADVPPVRGIALPEGAVVVRVSEQGPLTNAHGYVAMTPIAIRQDYEARGGVDLEIIVSEDEVYEVEMLVSTGEHRMFLKGRAVCEEGTEFQAVVAPEIDAEGLPAPAGSPAAPGQP